MLMVILLPLLPGMAILRALQTLAIRLQPFIGRTTGVATLLLAVLSVLVPGDDLSGAKGHLAVAAQLVSFQIVTTLPYWFGFGLPHEEQIVVSAGTEPASSDQGGEAPGQTRSSDTRCGRAGASRTTLRAPRAPSGIAPRQGPSAPDRLHLAARHQPRHRHRHGFEHWRIDPVDAPALRSSVFWLPFGRKKQGRISPPCPMVRTCCRRPNRVELRRARQRGCAGTREPAPTADHAHPLPMLVMAGLARIARRLTNSC